MIRPIGIRFLRAVHILRVSDLAILTPLLMKERYSHFAVREMARVYIKRGLISAMPVQHRHWRQANVLRITPEGARLLGYSPAEQKAAKQWIEATARWTGTSRVFHELAISTCHAALLKGQHEKKYRLTYWSQGRETQLGNLRPDFLYRLNDEPLKACELDMGSSPLWRDKHHHSTIQGKVESYSTIDEEPFLVQFVVFGDDTDRMNGIRSVLNKHGGTGHPVNFWSVVGLGHYKKQLLGATTEGVRVRT